MAWLTVFDADAVKHLCVTVLPWLLKAIILQQLSFFRVIVVRLGLYWNKKLISLEVSFITIIVIPNTHAFLVVADEPECGIGHPACDLTRQCTQPTAKISSVHFPNAYYRKTTCSWRIVEKMGSFIELTILAFDINSRQKCTQASTSLTIFDGSSEQSDILGIYCNETAPPKALKSSFNNMFLKFASGTDEPGRGFLAEYQARRFELDSSFGNTSGKKRKENVSTEGILFFSWLVVCSLCFQLTQTWMDI